MVQWSFEKYINYHTIILASYLNSSSDSYHNTLQKLITDSIIRKEDYQWRFIVRHNNNNNNKEAIWKRQSMTGTKKHQKGLYVDPRCNISFDSTIVYQDSFAKNCCFTFLIHLHIFDLPRSLFLCFSAMMTILRSKCWCSEVIFA